MEDKKLTGYPSVDKPWLKYYSEEAINVPLPECTVYENIWQHNKDYLNDIAIKYYGCKITYRKVFNEVERAAKAFRRAGIKKGDCIALCSASVPEAVYIVLACSRIGAVANFVNPMFTAEQMVARINDTSADYLVVLDAMHHFISDVIVKTCIKHVIVVPATGSLPAPMRAIARLRGKKDSNLDAAMADKTKYVLWNDFLLSGADYAGQIDEPYEKDMPVVMVYSSGTTGASKGIQLTNDGLNATTAQEVMAQLAHARNVSFLSIVPIWFSTGVSLSVIAPLYLGATTILEPVFSNKTFTADLIKYKPQYMIVATGLWLYAVGCGLLDKKDLSFIVRPMTGGDQLLPRTENRLNAFLKDHGCKTVLNKGWGMCELGGTVTFSYNPNGHAGDVGIPLPLVTVAAFDLDTDDEQQYDHRGELRVVSPCRMLGYYKNSEATAEFYHVGKDGQTWACTGDIGYVDKDGNVFVLGRAHDCYTAPDGKRYYLFDAENVILQDEAVELCEVVDIPVQGSSIPVAHLLLNEKNHEAAGDVVRRIDALCRVQLDKYAVPRGYKVREGFTIKPSGKRDTEALKKERDGYVTAEGKEISF